MTRSIDIARIEAAKGLIDPVFLDSPLVGHAALDAALGCEVLAKVETLNPIRSFKGRGTELFAAQELRAGDRLVCASAGNFGQGLARAAVRRGAECVVFAALTANPLKVEAMRRLGATVRLEGHDFDAAKAAARLFAAESGLRFVEDGREPAIAEGAGTIGLEIASQAPGIGTVLVPLGNGALLAGVAAALRHAAPGAEVLGVVAARAPSMKLSLEQGRAVETAEAATIADGIAVRVPVPEALEMLRGRVDGILAVEEEGILRAMRLLHETLGLVVEPSGAVGIAAMLADPGRFGGQRVATILCGGNLTPQQVRDWLVPAGTAVP
ncbi:threonine ammonia-lyase [Arenibaculum pallidiluteum]|uniref:threonine ammonia-lyase n=1 Tax=Arenibaculum pallidiluteum TaxID=2812559 RepID=UPI001A966858|nr:pyridoxal-phosphate dependent enzyme [Arenibaculum pallidiluteum]